MNLFKTQETQERVIHNTRNFSIIAHIDHGKSTLADRFLEITGTIPKRKMREQFLDQMELERERGITIKMQPVRMNYSLADTNYQLNLIDTPGHIDFSYEVSRALKAVEGAILLVDATQGVQAQTLANLYLAQEQGLVIVPAINKIDLPSSRPDEVEKEIKDILGKDAPIIKISAKEGTNVEDLLKEVIEKMPPPKGDSSNPLAALIFDSLYDPYRGVLAYVRVMDGRIKAGEKIFLMGSRVQSEAVEVGIFKPNLESADSLSAGEIGYIATGLKDVNFCRVGDTITGLSRQISRAFPGYKEPEPMIFASLYSSSGSGQSFAENKDYNLLKDALNKLKLNDASLFFEPESSEALGKGFKCGFLGMLHLEIVSERLKREYGLELVVTTPSVAYQLVEKSGKERVIYSPEDLPESGKIEKLKEPWVNLEVICPNSYLGSVMKLLQASSGVYETTQYLVTGRIIMKYEAPLREIIVDFYDRLKSLTSGYASMSYKMADWREADLVKMDIIVAGERMPALSRIVPRKDVYEKSRALVKKLKEVLPRQWFTLAIQASVGGKIIARETIVAMKKDVTGYLYGGDRTRKMKLWKKQQAGKKKMKEIGKIKIPQRVFLEILKK